MVDPIDDIARQARQGSVSAIIQILNEKLADSGVRTRAVFAGGVLQLLCEAAKPEQLEQPTLVDRVRHILESLQPRHIRRVNINSRIVREQQLLWLDEINRDPEHQLLWSEEIKLHQANPLKRWVEDLFAGPPVPAKPLPKSARSDRAQRQFWRGIIGGISLSLLLLFIGWIVSERLDVQVASSPDPGPSESPTPSPQASPVVAPVPPTDDPFVQAVRLAERAVRDGQQAKTAADWLDLATRWQRASDLMAEVPPADDRFRTAQDRIRAYSENSKAALAKAEQERQKESGQIVIPSASPSTALQ
ncbi:MAG TPA: hypothetical protein V6C78_32860 [Crinalium sp.]